MAATKEKVHESIAKVMKSIGSISKGGKTPQYKYRSYEQVIKALQPLFIEHGLYAGSRIEDVSVTGQMVTATVIYRLTSTADGSYIETAVLAQGSDRADKGAYKLMSGAIKYAYGQLFMIPFEGDDPEDPRNDASNYKAAPKSKPKANPGADANYQCKVALDGSKKAIKDCNEEELNFVLGNLREAEMKRDANSDLAAKLADVCVAVGKEKGFKVAPF